MAYTAADLSAVQRAIASGELRVRFPDGSEVYYRTTGELLAAEARILQDLADQQPGGAVRSTTVAYDRG